MRIMTVMIVILHVRAVIQPFDNDDDDVVADDETEQREEVNKEKERATVERVEDRRIDAVESILCLAILNDDIRVGLYHHVGGALVKLQGGMLQLPEHQGLGARQQDGDHPGDKDHGPCQKKIRVLTLYVNRKIKTILSYILPEIFNIWEIFASFFMGSAKFLDLKKQALLLLR